MKEIDSAKETYNFKGPTNRSQPIFESLHDLEIKMTNL